RVSRYGVIAYASSLDQVGPIAREVADVAVVLEAIAGHDPADSTASPRPVPSYAAALDGSVRGLRLGLPREYFVEGMQPDVERGVRAAVAELERLGAAVEPVSLPHTEYAIATYYLIATAEASSNLARYDGIRYGLREPRPALTEMYEAARVASYISVSAGGDARRRLRRRGEAADHARHLRALRRLLRRVLSEGAAGPHAHPARLSAGARALRRAGHAGGAHHSLPPGREDG